MGIRPKGSGETLHLTGTADELADDLKATTEGFAKPFGESIEEIAATAESANAGASELAKRVKALEDAQPGRVPVTVWWSGAGAVPEVSSGSTVVDVSTGEVWAV